MLWAEAQLQHLLPVSYFHIVFTVPPMLRPFFAGPQRRNRLTELFSRTSSQAADSSEELDSPRVVRA